MGFMDTIILFTLPACEQAVYRPARMEPGQQDSRLLTARERARMKPSLEHSRPFGDDAWVPRTVSRPGLQHTLRREERTEKEKQHEPVKE
jgi:hypothetical protein